MTTPQKVLIGGLGRFGDAVAETLWKSGSDVTVVERDPQLVEAIKGHTHAAFVADGAEQQVLESIGAQRMDVAVVTFGDAFESAVLAVSALKTLPQDTKGRAFADLVRQMELGGVDLAGLSQF